MSSCKRIEAGATAILPSALNPPAKGNICRGLCYRGKKVFIKYNKNIINKATAGRERGNEAQGGAVCTAQGCQGTALAT